MVAVKVDDTPAGRPPLGVDKADVIYIAEVEGGLTRMLAVFASAKPRVRVRVRGSGRVVLFRNGRRIEGTWSRPRIGAPTTFTDVAGSRCPSP